MKFKLKEIFVMTLFVALLGGFVGGITWGLLFIMDAGIHFLWVDVKNAISFPFYSIIVCSFGGLLIGLWEQRFGPYPREMAEVLNKVKKGEKIPYNNLHIIAIAALLPLIFGGNLGPEAGLSGVIAGLCFWFSDRFKFIFSEMEELPQIGVAATVGVIFGSPLFAFVNQFEDENKPTAIPKNIKIFVYFVGILSGYGILTLLQNLFGGKLGMGHFPAIETVSGGEWAAAIPLAFVGVMAGMLYYLFKRLVKIAVKPLQKNIILKGIIGGVILGVVGMILPYTMFSGERQMTEVMNSWQGMGFVVLFITGIVKLLMGSVCHQMGWRGGKIFPTIFSGVAIGYAFALVLPIDSIFCVAIVTAALTATVMRKPLAVILLLLICFPINGIVPMTIGAVIGGAIPVPEWIGSTEED
ncbi:chloride channel protein [Acetobacterium woodii]|uniref:chloride channel protein n=1 Tax=Acetobacterium woodii TaxID=33952 RepID=UPI0002D86A25|nr:chloride channel protein [Acetobacterium woodii]